MKLIFLLFTGILLFSSCELITNPGKVNTDADPGDSALITERVLNHLQLEMGHDSVEYRSPAAKLMFTGIYTLGDTLSAINKLRGDAAGYFAGFTRLQLLENEDSGISNFHNDLKALRHEYSALVNGKYKLLDKENPYAIGFERILNQDTLLVILNTNEDNQALRENFSYGSLTLLLSNYEDGPMPQIEHSLALRPFEVRIYKL